MDEAARTVCNASTAELELEYRFLQPLWNLVLRYDFHTINTIFFYLAIYMTAVLPWMICDLYGKNWWIQKYKIQPDKDVTPEQVRKAVLLTMWNNMVYVLPMAVAQWVYQPLEELPVLAPTLFEFIWQPFAALAILDVEYFIWHVLHHKVRWLYRHVHSVHHQYSSPSSWVTQYLHPWELISNGTFSTTAPWVIGCHPLTEVWYQIFAVWGSVEIHSGYDLPFMLHKCIHRWCPFWGGSPSHDMHHQKPSTNFAPFYTYLDILCGTYCPGQLAGGVKPKALLDWENTEKDSKIAARQAKLQSEITPKDKVC